MTSPDTPAPTISQDVESAVDHSKLFRSREWATIRDTLVPLWPRSAVGDACDPNSAATAIETALSTISQDVPAPAAVTAEMVGAYATWARDLGSLLSVQDRGTAEMGFKAGWSAALSAATPLQSDLAAAARALVDAGGAAFRVHGGKGDRFGDVPVPVAAYVALRAALQGADNHE